MFIFLCDRKITVNYELCGKMCVCVSHWYETTLHHLASILRNTGVLRQLHMSQLQQLNWPPGLP